VNGVSGIWALLAADSKRISSDPFLLLMLVYPWILMGVLRSFLPDIERALAGRVDINAYAPLVVCLLVVMVPYSLGIVLGFQLVEEKEARCLAAVAVTPMSLAPYIGYRVGVYSAIALPQVVGLHEILGLVDVRVAYLCWVAVAAAPSLPLMALVLANFSSNQVEAFAVMKGAGFLVLGPLAAVFFLPAHWDLLVGVLPTYWPVKTYALAVAGEGLALVASTGVALLFQGACTVVLYRRLAHRVLGN
jgi:fluoroquinolone transport system permease protein